MTSSETHEPLTLPRNMSDLLFKIAVAAGVAGLVLALFVVWPFGGLRRLFLSYLTAYCFVLTIALGALFFVMLHHITRAGWSVNVRRVPEALANTMPVLAVLSLPILASFLIPGQEWNAETGARPTLYPWAVSAPHHGEEAHGEAGEESPEVTSAGPGLEQRDATAPEQNPEAPVDSPAAVPEPVLDREALTVAHAHEHLRYTHLTAEKAPYLNRPFFLLRIVLYFGVWIGLAGFYYRNSVLQDSTGDPALTTKMQRFAPVGFLLYALTLTGAAFDLIMSVDPHFFSTIFGGYVFAGGVVGFYATCILIYQFLRANGLLKGSVTRDHYHDLGKWLFAFVFFWGYVAFSQYMLIWYANIPETTYWYAVRGSTTVSANWYWGAWPSVAEHPEAPAGVSWWTVVSLILLFGHLLIPFAGLLSRHVKRNLTVLGIWAAWMLVMHYIDIYWLIMPEMLHGGWRLLPLPELACLLFVVAVVGGYFVRTLSSAKLRPAADPRLHESLAFHQI